MSQVIRVSPTRLVTRETNLDRPDYRTLTGMTSAESCTSSPR